MSDLDEKQKWLISAYSAILFIVITSPFMYKITNSLTNLVGWETSVNGCPNAGGLVLHTAVFLVLVRVLMLVPLPGAK